MELRVQRQSHRTTLFLSFIFLLVTGLAILVFPAQTTALDPSLENLYVETGTGSTSALTSGSLQAPTQAASDGQVRVSKSIHYNIDSATNAPDGTITVTLSAHANIYAYDSDTNRRPLRAMECGNYLVFTRCVNEFAVVGNLPQGLSLENNDTIIWAINNQDLILGSNALEVSYILSVVNPPHQPPYTLSYWYSTGEAEVRFMPSSTNPYYWTMQETTADEFTASMSWNAGNGINGGSIIDNFLGITITFPSNESRNQGLQPYNEDGSMNLAGRWNWWPQNTNTQNQAAIVTTAEGVQRLSWQLYWVRAAENRNVFTIKDFHGPGLDIQYEIYLRGPGGNEAVPGGRTIVSRDYFQRNFNINQHDAFHWDGEVIAAPLSVIGQIKITEPRTTISNFNLNIAKAFADDDYHAQWCMCKDSEFIMHVRSTTADLYLNFTNIEAGIYEYNGISPHPTPVRFSVNRPALLQNVPVLDELGQQKTYSLVEYFTWDETALRAPRVEVSYRIGQEAALSSAIITPQADEEITVTAVNNFLNPAYGLMRILKILDGFPADWGINEHTNFQFRVWDVDAGRYLLFVLPDEEALAPDSGWSGFGWVEDSYFRVGTYAPNAGGIWDFCDPYWEARHQAGSAQILTELGIRKLQTVELSNLWSGNYEIHELDFNGNLLDSSPAYEWWQARYTFNGNGGSGTQGILQPSGVLDVTMANTFALGEAHLSLFKELSGHPADWGVDKSSEFTIFVRDLSTTSRLLFDPIRQEDGTWFHIGYIDGEGNRTPDDSGWHNDNDLNQAIYELLISVNQPIVLSGIDTGESRRYIIEEIAEDGQGVRIFTSDEEITDTELGGIIVRPYDNIVVTIVNHYFNKLDGRIAIFKELQGTYRQHGVSDETTFAAMIRNPNTDRYLLLRHNPIDIINHSFSPQLAMKSYSHVGEYNPTTGIVYLLVRVAGDEAWSYEASGELAQHPGLTTQIIFSVEKAALIDDLVPGDFIISELPCPYDSYQPSISNAGNVHIEDKDALGITIVNTWQREIIPTALDVWMMLPVAAIMILASLAVLIFSIRFHRRIKNLSPL